MTIQTGPVSSTEEQRTSSPSTAVRLGGRAQVCHVNGIWRHPNADRLERLELSIGVTVVTGPHYRTDLSGIYIPAGALLPGYLAEDMWLVGRASANRFVEVVEKNMRGIVSPGLFAGSEYQPDRAHPFKPWPYWRSHWREGEDVAAFLGIRFLDGT